MYCYKNNRLSSEANVLQRKLSEGTAVEARLLLVSLAVGVITAVGPPCQAGVFLQFDDPVSSCALALLSWH